MFLVNLPIGAAVLGLGIALLPGARAKGAPVRLDVAGAVTVTGALMLAVYAIVGGNEAGWTSARTLAMLGGALALLALFVAIEARVEAPLMPLGLFRSATLNAANVIAVLWSAAMFAWFFLSALYLQRVLGYSAMQVGLAFLPSNLIMAACSLGISARVVMHFGIRWPLAFGLLCAAIGLALFALAPVDGGFVAHVLPGMLLLGVGAGIAFNPLLLAAMQDVDESESGLASGIVNTAFMMGGALGLAVLASVAAAHTGTSADLSALNDGYRLAFAAGALCALVAAAVGAALMPSQAAAARTVARRHREHELARNAVAAADAPRRERLQVAGANARARLGVEARPGERDRPADERCVRRVVVVRVGKRRRDALLLDGDEARARARARQRVAAAEREEQRADVALHFRVDDREHRRPAAARRARPRRRRRRGRPAAERAPSPAARARDRART